MLGFSIQEGVVMSANRPPKPRLEVASAGKRHYIQVPTRNAADLLGYLRRHGVHAAPPEPCSADVDNIELGRKVDAAAVQELLDRWA